LNINLPLLFKLYEAYSDPDINAVTLEKIKQFVRDLQLDYTDYQIRFLYYHSLESKINEEMGNFYYFLLFMFKHICLDLFTLYNKMKFIEFLDFLVRLADQIIKFENA